MYQPDEQTTAQDRVLVYSRPAGSDAEWTFEAAVPIAVGTEYGASIEVDGAEGDVAVLAFPVTHPENPNDRSAPSRVAPDPAKTESDGEGALLPGSPFREETAVGFEEHTDVDGDVINDGTGSTDAPLEAAPEAPAVVADPEDADKAVVLGGNDVARMESEHSADPQ